MKINPATQRILAVAATAFGLASSLAFAQTVVFAEDFESSEDGTWPVLADDPAAAPDVDAAQSDGFTSGAVPTTYWVGATQGFGGTRRGIVDEDHGDFTEAGAGKQAFAFRYTNSGLTTADGVIGSLASGATYTVTFDVVLDGHNSTTPYTARLVTFNGAARNDVRGGGGGTGSTSVLATASGNATGDGLYTTVTLSYTSDGTESTIGHDVALRFFGATSSAIIDNVEIEVEVPVDTAAPTPDPMEFLVAPQAVSATSITMAAVTATDSSPPVEYLFENTTNATDSGWSTATSWTDIGLTTGVSYTYQVTARDAVGNAGTASATASATAEADSVAPTPDPMTFAVDPFTSAPGTLSMTAATATDAYGSDPVEYRFENTTNSEFRDWDTDPSWSNSGLSEGATYGYQVKARDAVGNETAFSAVVNGTVEDNTPPDPNPMTFAVSPKAASATSITMTATTATDAYPSNPVEYFFENTTDATNSGWITSTTWTETGLTTGATYDYQVKARDAAGNETGFSGVASAVPEADTVAPTPNPMTFAVEPYPSATGTISMTATTATDAYGAGPVEYYFENTTNSDNSGWTTSSSWSNSGLTDGATYGYRVKARDVTGNETALSDEVTATAQVVTTVFAEEFESSEDGTWPVLAADPAAAPDVDAAQSDGNTSGAVPTDYWVGANQGFGGNRRGIVDEDHGDFTEAGAGKQAFAFRYTNSGLTTAEGVIGSLAAGATYIVTFDVVLDGHNSSTPYTARLVTFNGAARDDVRGGGGGTGSTSVLASATGNATGDGNYATVTFNYTSDGTEGVLGHDVALRFFGATSSAIIDNVQVSVAGVGSGGDTYADWIDGYDVGTLTGFDDDFDLDGNGNGLENYFGTDPSVFSAGLTAGEFSTNGSTTFTFTHPLNPTPATDVSAVYRWSDDLETFYDDGSPNGASTTTVSFEQGTPSGGMVTVTATITGTVIPDKLFVVVEATQN